jgi:hypothetical protein
MKPEKLETEIARALRSGQDVLAQQLIVLREQLAREGQSERGQPRG